MKINIESINIAEFDIPNDLSNLNGKRVTYDISLDNRVTATEKHEDVILCEVQVTLTEPESQTILVILRCQNFYLIEGLRGLVVVHGDDTVELPSKIIEVISQISIGTVRGILYERLGNTVLGKMLLPVLEIGEIEL